MEKKRKKGDRKGFTTGACAAAAARAATRLLIQGSPLTEIESTLPNRQRVTFKLNQAKIEDSKAICSVIKDAGDDPDCTDGAELVAEVGLKSTSGIDIFGGEGVATVSKPGLGLELGTPAINPVPRRNILEMVQSELTRAGYQGAVVTVHVPGGEEMAKKTLNSRLGLVGGISILGTTGIVVPYSTAAFQASVLQAVDVAMSQGQDELVLTTGGKSETYAMSLFPDLEESAFIQMGDFVGQALKRCELKKIKRAILVGMVGKFSKMANGRMMTHAAGSRVNMDLLSDFAKGFGASSALCEAIRNANTARHVLELCQEQGVEREMAARVCRGVVQTGKNHVKGDLEIHAYMVDFDGRLLGNHAQCEERI